MRFRAYFRLSAVRKPLILALLRLVVFVFPTAYLFTLSDGVLKIVWWTFPIAEILTAVFAYVFLVNVKRAKIEPMSDEI